MSGLLRRKALCRPPLDWWREARGYYWAARRLGDTRPRAIVGTLRDAARGQV